jgi:cell division control protein 7
MARQRAVRVKPDDYQIPIHEDPSSDGYCASELEETEQDTQVPSNRHGAPGGVEEDQFSEEEPDERVAEDIAQFQSTFRGVSKRYRLINRIGEGALQYCPSSQQPTTGNQTQSL